MKLELFLLALVGSAQAINKVEKCVIDKKCSLSDQVCSQNCVRESLTSEELGQVAACIKKCPSTSENSPCQLKCAEDVFDSLEQLPVGEAKPTATAISGSKATETTDSTSKTTGATTDSSRTSTTATGGASSTAATTGGASTSGASAIVAKSTTFTGLAIIGLIYFL